MNAQAGQGSAEGAKGPSAPTKAKRIELAKSASVDDAVAVIFETCLTHWTANEAAALSGGNPEGVHEMRVALRRMRAALSDFQEIIPAAQVSWQKRETKWLITTLGMARDWDVFLSELLAPVVAARPDHTGLAELRMAAEAERDKGYARTRRAIQSSRYSALLARMRRWLSAKSWRQGSNRRRKSLDEPAVKMADRLLKKRHKAVLKLGHDFKTLPPQQRHQLRIALKKLRYTAEFFRSLYQRKPEKSYFSTLAELQNSLGHMNDVVVANHLLKRLSATRDRQRVFANLPTAIAIVVRWHTHSASSWEGQAEANWREFCHCDAFW